MNHRTVTATTKAWITQWTGLEDIAPNVADQEIVDTLVFSNADMKKHSYTLVGEACIHVQLVDDRAVVENKVESLQAEKTALLAEAHAKATSIDRKIQTLLAITQ